MKKWLAAVLLALPGCAGSPVAAGPDLRIAWEKNFLTIRADGDPFPPIQIWYLEAYCRSGSTARKWQETVIPHRTEKVRDDGRTIELLCRVEGGVEVRHVITAGRGDVAFRVEAVNTGPAYVDAVWAQPCVRVGPFTGADKTSYVKQAFIFVDGRRTFLDTTGPPGPAVYTPGQVFLPPGIDPKDANPRPHCPQVPSNGLIGAVSADGRWLTATAWEPYQELFQGVIACIHSDFRLGGLKPGETRRARGRLYVLDNDPELLLKRYRADSPS